jgi:hypothetical protein
MLLVKFIWERALHLNSQLDSFFEYHIIFYIAKLLLYQRLILFSNPLNCTRVSGEMATKRQSKTPKNSLPIILLPIIIVAYHSSQPVPLHATITTLLQLAYRECVRSRNDHLCTVCHLQDHKTRSAFTRRESTMNDSSHISVNLPHPWTWRRTLSCHAGGPLLVSDVVGWQLSHTLP